MPPGFPTDPWKTLRVSHPTHCPCDNTGDISNELSMGTFLTSFDTCLETPCLDRLFLTPYICIMQTKIDSSEMELDAQAARLHRARATLIRRYRLSDREEICCHGVTVAQSHALEVVVRQPGAAMGEVAARLGVAMSTATRLADQLVAKDLLRRAVDPADRRMWRVWPTVAGQQLASTIERELRSRERQVLTSIPADHRESVLSALELLDCASESWLKGGDEPQGGCCDG